MGHAILNPRDRHRDRISPDPSGVQALKDAYGVRGLNSASLELNPPPFKLRHHGDLTPCLTRPQINSEGVQRSRQRRRTDGRAPFGPLFSWGSFFSRIEACSSTTLRPQTSKRPEEQNPFSLNRPEVLRSSLWPSWPGLASPEFLSSARKRRDGFPGLPLSFLLVPGVGLYLWANFVSAPDILIASLAWILAGSGLLLGGGRGLRLLLLPACFLVFAIPLPIVLVNHWIWPLQLLTGETAVGDSQLHGDESRFSTATSSIRRRGLFRSSKAAAGFAPSRRSPWRASYMHTCFFEVVSRQSSWSSQHLS